MDSRKKVGMGLASLLLAAGCSYRDYSHSDLANAKPELSKKYMGEVRAYSERNRAERQQDLESIAIDLQGSSDTPEIQEAFYLADESVRGFLQQQNPQRIPNAEITYLSKNFSDEGIRFSRTPFGYQTQETQLNTNTFRDAQLTTAILIGAFSTFDDKTDVSMFMLGGKEKDKCGGYQIYIVGPSDLTRTSFASNRTRYPSMKNGYVTLAKDRSIVLTLNSPETLGTRRASDGMEVFQRIYHFAAQGKITEPIDIGGDILERAVQSDQYARKSFSLVPAIGLERISEALYVTFASNLEDHPNLISICDYPYKDSHLVIIAAGNCPSGVKPMFFPREDRPDQVSIEEVDPGTPVELPWIGRPDTAIKNVKDRAR